MTIRFGGPFADFLIGSAGPDILLGLGGEDSLFGLGGGDWLAGGGGDDLLEGDSPPPNVRLGFPVGEPGGDTLFGGAGDDTLNGGGGDDSLAGGTGGDVLSGSEGADTLNGGAGDDVLNGGFSLGHGDTLTGGAGSDTLTGGGGVDTFLFAEGDLPGTPRDADRITDFQTSEIINIIADQDFILFDTATDEGSLTGVARSGDTTTYLVEDGHGRDLGYLAVTTVLGLPLIEGRDYEFV